MLIGTANNAGQYVGELTLANRSKTFDCNPGDILLARPAWSKSVDNYWHYLRGVSNIGSISDDYPIDGTFGSSQWNFCPFRCSGTSMTISMNAHVPGGGTDAQITALSVPVFRIPAGLSCSFSSVGTFPAGQDLGICLSRRGVTLTTFRVYNLGGAITSTFRNFFSPVGVYYFSYNQAVPAPGAFSWYSAGQYFDAGGATYLDTYSLKCLRIVPAGNPMSMMMNIVIPNNSNDL